ncbi:MAG: helix-turn-helix domain-containing protein [Sphingomonas sp.]
MLDTKVKPVRALARGLDVLIELQRVRAASLHDLHVALGLPKATLLRMLVTLGSRGLVWQRLADGAYLPHLSTETTPEEQAARIAEVASPHLETLSRIVAWPSVIAAPRLDHLEIVETNSRLLRLDSAILGPVGAKLSYIHTATGRAYLAACGAEERGEILARLRPRANAAEGDALIARIVEDTAARGYALRDPLHPWPDRSRQAVRNDGRHSMAVAVHVRGRAVAGINITWPARRTATDEVVGRHLGTLQATAALIGAELAGAG